MGQVSGLDYAAAAAAELIVLCALAGLLTGLFSRAGWRATGRPVPVPVPVQATVPATLPARPAPVCLSIPRVSAGRTSIRAQIRQAYLQADAPAARALLAAGWPTGYGQQWAG